MKKVTYIFALVLMILMSTTSNASAWILVKLSNMAEKLNIYFYNKCIFTVMMRRTLIDKQKLKIVKW